jgi:hypothetical protein
MDLLQYLSPRQDNGYLYKKKLEEIALKLESLAGIAPEDAPAESRFLLEINFSEPSKSHVKSQKYWILAINAALNAQRHQLALGARTKRIKTRSIGNSPVKPSWE